MRNLHLVVGVAGSDRPTWHPVCSSNIHSTHTSTPLSHYLFSALYHAPACTQQPLTRRSLSRSLSIAQLYEFLARRTNANFNGIVLQRLKASKSNRSPLGLARLARYMKGQDGKIAVLVGTVTDDTRLAALPVPKLRICALRVTETARARILANGGEVLHLLTTTHTCARFSPHHEEEQQQAQ